MSSTIDQPNEALPGLPLPEGIVEDYIDCSTSCGLKWHILKAGEPGKPLVLFCHGFPELAYSWRKVLPAIAKAGYYCVAMDQRGYGRTTGWPQKQPFEAVDLNDFVFTNLVRDLVCLVYGLGYKTVYSIIGHDFGGVSSAMAALIRPDMFLSTIQMSHPHHRPAEPISPREKGEIKKVDIQAELAKLAQPRKHYKWYNSSPNAARDWENPSQGLKSFLRGYFHLKSADWEANKPQPLTKWSAQELAHMPEYYIMQAEHSMPETVEYNMASENYYKTERWLSIEDMRVYSSEWERTGFQGALNWYRAQTASTKQSARDILLFSGRRIEVPCVFISGKQDWGNYQQPGALEGYEDPQVVKEGCYRGAKFVDGAGHWVQQEQPEAVIMEILAFFKTL
ncbi:Bifunctional epoxide hydrolase 2 [Daldinia childiae]|uniref:Bifunctional epoxide hydrolase 2 n=1 Tax=Daldinia childiae TaxID=326645 RepID=UPI0014457217|nr:Bifunctional epoxide hydrolase 2 [Daldinia childiae]KAF3054785.1 Bifunctional epoxide hydrolase 2 [Daldinia childiae]